MANTTIVSENFHLNVDTDKLATDPIRSLKKGSLVKLSVRELHEMYWIPIQGFYIPYCSESNSFEEKLRVWQWASGRTIQNVTFLILQDLDNLNVVHGWISIVYSDGRIDMAKGWFQYDMLIRCIDFSAVDDS